MAILVHITSADNKKSITRSGIKPGDNNVVFFMPHMKDFLISHQWARELKRSGIKNFAAVDFKLPNDEAIWFGKYNSRHQRLALNKAISWLMKSDNKFGYEFFIDRKIDAREVLRIRDIPKPMGWRYEPDSHGKAPCPCPMCLQKGGYKTKKLRELNRETMSRKKAKDILVKSNDDDELWKAVCRLQGKWKRESPRYLERLLEFEDKDLLIELVELLSEYRHPLAKNYLKILSTSLQDDVKELSLQYLGKI